MLFRDVLYQKPDKFNGGESALHIGIVFMAVVVKRDIFAIIGINTFLSNYRPSEIPADVFDYGIRIAGPMRFSISLSNAVWKDFLRSV